MVRDIIQLLQSGASNRWHNNPDMTNTPDNLAEHQWHVAMLVKYLCPEADAGFLFHALTHDVGEMFAGDLPYDFKINYPKVAAAHKEAEEELAALLVEPYVLLDEELAILKVADWLSSFWHVAKTNPALINREDWQDQIDYFLDVAGEISGDTYKKVFSLVYDIEGIAEKGCTKKASIGWVFNKGLTEYDAA